MAQKPVPGSRLVAHLGHLDCVKNVRDISGSARHYSVKLDGTLVRTQISEIEEKLGWKLTGGNHHGSMFFTQKY